MSIREKLLITAATLACISQAQAHESVLAGNTKSFRPDGHAPIGVMGDHMHKRGEWMIAYRYMHMTMEDNLAGSDGISSAEIVSTIPNPNGPPPTVRVVPTKMTTQMHMLGAMYAPSDKLTLMAMVHYLDKEMDHQSFMGMMGTTELGTFTTSSSGIGDTRVGALVRLHSSQTQKIHLNLGLSLPTGSIDESGTVLPVQPCACPTPCSWARAPTTWSRVSPTRATRTSSAGAPSTRQRSPWGPMTRTTPWGTAIN